MILHQNGKPIWVDSRMVVVVTPGRAAEDAPNPDRDLSVLLLTSGHEVWCDEPTDIVIAKVAVVLE